MAKGDIIMVSQRELKLLRLYWERRVIFISPFPDRGPNLHSGRVYRF
jgi:hypothetical protein